MEHFMEMKTKYYNVRKTLLDMLTDRKYIIPKSLYVGFNEFSVIYDNYNFDLKVKHLVDDSLIIVTFFTDFKNFTKKDFYTMINKLYEEYDTDTKIIIVLREKCNQTTMKELLLEKNKNIEIFIIDRLLFNITKHELVPKHELLSKSEIEELLKKYRCTVNQLPKVFKTDPISKYYGAKTGDVFKIYRNSSSLGKTIAYRYVK